MKPTRVGEDIVAVIRRATDGRPPPVVRVRGVGRRQIGEDELGGITGERTSIAAPLRHVLHLHGGYHVGGSPATYRNLAARLADGLQAEVLVIDLPLAPEHPHPADLDQACAAYDAMVRRNGIDPGAVAITGDSAGAGLAVALVQRLHAAKQPPPGALILLSPWLDLTCSAASVDGNDGRDDMLSAAALRAAARLYAADMPLDDPAVSPLLGSLDGLPPTLITIDASEVLLDDSTHFAERATSGGVDVQLHRTDGLFHIWPITVPFLPEARTTVASIVRFLDARLDTSP